MIKQFIKHSFVFAVGVALLLTCHASIAGQQENENSISVEGLNKVYCISEDKITFEVENRSTEDLWIGIMIEKRRADGEWKEFCPDIHQEKISTKETMIVFPFKRGVKIEMKWEPKKAGVYGELESGQYRFMGYINRKGEAPGREIMLGEFALESCANR